MSTDTHAPSADKQSIFQLPSAAPGPQPHLCASLYGSSMGLLIAEQAKAHNGVVVVLAEDTSSANRLEEQLQFYLRGVENTPILAFPDWETLPYDVFSPHQDIVSQRLEALYRLPQTPRGVLIVPVATLMQRLCPKEFVVGNSLVINTGDRINIEQLRTNLTTSGYNAVSQVMDHGEFAVRGSIIDLFPSGSTQPIRLDLFDDEIDSIRLFDVETQRTEKKIEQVRLLPAREFPFTDQAITRFRRAYLDMFEGDPQKNQIYREVSKGHIPNGVEYYLPLFFDELASLFDYLPKNTLVIRTTHAADATTKLFTDIEDRYEQRRYDIERPILEPSKLYLRPDEVMQRLNALPSLQLQNFEANDLQNKRFSNFATLALPKLAFNARTEQPADALTAFIRDFGGRVLFVAESEGRREVLLEMLRNYGIVPASCKHWQEFAQSQTMLGLTVAPLESGLVLDNPKIALITEAQLFGERVQQRRRRNKQQRDADNIVRNLTELNIGSPVVHQDHGVGRYLGLQKLELGGNVAEYLTLEYANGDKLYVPVSSLHLISRYTGAAPENAPLHRLGTDQWDRAKKRAAEKAHDVAAELLEIFARREASQGHAFRTHDEDYATFAASFPFEETPDQQTAIEAVLSDMQRKRPMDRVVCGDVGFGKTEVSMRAAFVAANGGKQVVLLVPTTLLAQQHYENYLDRFADWPFKIELLSRFRSKKEQTDVIAGLKSGKVDIVIGTHKLLNEDIKYSNLGLVIVDEEHRFGVRQKEKLKALCANVDLLTLTATPIPRTLNMSLAGLRDLSIIATPPAQRLAVKTFVSQWDDGLIKEACTRELKRGGQVYFLHNDVESIERTSRELAELVPDAKVEFAHGQMRERELEMVMSDFYHRRFNILVCTTIIESGIDIPTANTIIINRADKLGLAQLHQLRGRVGRSHHRAYAYLLIPNRKTLTPDAEKRLEAIESLENLGAGFMLATHDLEIRGAGELLGEEQSGQIHEVGFSMYNDLLQRAVKSLKEGKQPELDRPLDHGAEVDLQTPALIPDDYLPDVHARLTLYKRIANCQDKEELRELQVEIIDRFGLMPDQLKMLITITELKLQANPLGILKIEFGAKGGRIIFTERPNIDPMKIIKLIQTKPMLYKMDGQDKLRVLGEYATAKERVEKLQNLMREFVA
ncbi:MAG: transcription-repair coupling factor [Gammaproteobacteria bacterium]|nr:transcription-repair coupling factor [Gammaproteobacteria bacterium]